MTEGVDRAYAAFGGNTGAPAFAHIRRGALVGHSATRIGRKSTGVDGRGNEPIGDLLGALMKGLAFSPSMAADLAVVEDQGQGIGQKPNHGQHDQRRGLMDSGVFEMAVGGDGLKNFCIDSPTAAAELMDEQRRDRAEFEIGGVEVGALLRHRRLALDSMTVFFANRLTRRGCSMRTVLTTRSRRSATGQSTSGKCQ